VANRPTGYLVFDPYSIQGYRLDGEGQTYLGLMDLIKIPETDNLQMYQL